MENPQEAQERLLETLVRRNLATEYGRKHGFADIKDLADYQRKVPIVHHEDIRDSIERMTRGEEKVLTAEKPVMFAQTAGATGKAKFIPVTPTCQRQGGTATWLCFARNDHSEMFAGKVITVVSPAIEGHTEAGIPYGSTSGMVIRELPKIVQSTYAVTYEVFEIDDYTAENYPLLHFGLPEKVSFLGSANPSSVLMLAEMADRLAEPLIRDIHDGKLGDEFDIAPELREVLAPKLAANPERAKELESFRKARGEKLLPADYWPQLAFIGCWKGSTVSSYIERFPEWFDPDGRGTIRARHGQPRLRSAHECARLRQWCRRRAHRAPQSLQLVPVGDVENKPDNPEDWTILGAHEIEVGKEYHVIVTTTGGLYRYDINDVIEVADRWHKTPVVVFRRKGRGMGNLTGEKVCVNHLIEAVEKAAQANGVDATHFKSEPDGKESRYVFKVEFAKPPSQDAARKFPDALDAALGECNIEWKSKRRSKRLKDPVLQVMKPGWYERGKQKRVAEGMRLFQAKTIILDAKQGYEPEEMEFEMSGA